jgi:DNA-binding XRE family transcriptional regulator
LSFWIATNRYKLSVIIDYQTGKVYDSHHSIPQFWGIALRRLESLPGAANRLTYESSVIYLLRQCNTNLTYPPKKSILWGKEDLPMEDRLGDRVRKTRERYGMAAAELARRVGISRNQLYMIESNKTPDPGALTIVAIAEILGVSTDFLLTGKRMTRRSKLEEDVPAPPQKRPRTRKAAPVG